MGEQQRNVAEPSGDQGMLFMPRSQCASLGEAGSQGLAPGLGLDMEIEGTQQQDSPTSPCFHSNPLEPVRLEMDGMLHAKGMGGEMEVARGWGHCEQEPQADLKQEQSSARLVRALGLGGQDSLSYSLQYQQLGNQRRHPEGAMHKLDSFNEAFANRHSLVQPPLLTSGMGGYGQNPTLCQMLSEKAPPHHYPHPRAPQQLLYPPGPAQQSRVMVPPSMHYSFPALHRFPQGHTSMPARQYHPQQNAPAMQYFLQQQQQPPQQPPLQQHKASLDAKHQLNQEHYAQASPSPQSQPPLQHAHQYREQGQRPGHQAHCLPARQEQYSPQYLYTDNPHYRQQAHHRDAIAMAEPLYVQPQPPPPHHSPDHSPQQINISASAEYTTACSRQDLHSGGQRPSTELLNSLATVASSQHPGAKDMASQGPNVYWSQMQASQSSAGMPLSSEQRRGMEDKMDSQYPITCTDCKDQFRTPSGLDLHTNTNGCMRTSPSVSQDNGKHLPRDVVCVTPPFMAASMSVRTPSVQSHDVVKAQQTSNFLHEQETQNFTRMADISTQESCGTDPPPYHCLTVYPSRLHKATTSLGEHQAPASPSAETSHYTPLPMLNPARKGSGLFNNLTDHSTELAGSPFPCNQYNGLDLGHQQNSTQVESRIPCINVGSQFQATLPDLLEMPLADQDKHNADLVWRPWKGLIDNPDTQQKVEDMLNMACSSVLPGGGTNREFALHCLFEEGGDIMGVLERLLLNTKVHPRSQALANYHYTGSCPWTPNERKAFNKTFSMHKKDFYMIQKMVKSKPIMECVEYYYSFKKILKFNKKPRPRLSDHEEDWVQVFRQDSVSEPPLRSPSLEPVQREGRIPCPTVVGNFPCKQCGKMFYKIKSRNAHMKIHRQQDDWQHRSQDSYYPPATYTPPSMGKPPSALPPYSNWDTRIIQEHLDAVTEAISCTNLPSLFHEDIKLNFGKEKCQNLFI